MDYPSGHHSHTRHHRRRSSEDEEETPYYPPPNTGPPPPPFSQSRNEFARPPPPFFQDQNEFAPPSPPHFQNPNEFAPPPPYFQGPRPDYFPPNEYAPPPPHPIQQTHMYGRQDFGSSDDYPPPPPVTHVSHEETGIRHETHHSFKPHVPSFVQDFTHHSSSAAPGIDFINKPTYKVYCKAEPNFRLTIRDGNVVLAPEDPSDEFQNWYKDEKYSTRVKDEEGCPCFSLVNEASGMAVKHSTGASQPVQLITYNPGVLDQSVLWTESKDLGDGYRAVRMVNNVRLNLDAFHGDEKSGGVHDGTTIVLWQWNKGNNQRWRVTPH